MPRTCSQHGNAINKKVAANKTILNIINNNIAITFFVYRVIPRYRVENGDKVLQIDRICHCKNLPKVNTVIGMATRVIMVIVIAMVLEVLVVLVIQVK